MSDGVVLTYFTDVFVAQHCAEFAMVLDWNSEQVGNHEHGQRFCEILHELAGTAVEELVDLLVRQAPDEFLVLAEPLGGDQLAQQSTRLGMVVGVHGDDVFGHRDGRAVFGDLIADVVALRRERQWRKGPGDGDTRGEGRVFVGRERLGVAGHSRRRRAVSPAAPGTAERR